MTDSIPALVERYKDALPDIARTVEEWLFNGASDDDTARALASLVLGSDPSMPTRAEIAQVQPAPAGMPGVEAVARAIALNPPNRTWENCKDSMRLVRDHEPTSRAVLALFAPLAQEVEEMKADRDAALLACRYETDMCQQALESLASAEARVAQAVEEEREACAEAAQRGLHGVSLAGVDKVYAEGMLDGLTLAADTIRARTAAAAIRGGEK